MTALSAAEQAAYAEVYDGAHNVDHAMVGLKPGAVCPRCESTARAVVAAVRPLIAKELIESAEIIRKFAESSPVTSAEARAIFDGILAALSRPTSEETRNG